MKTTDEWDSLTGSQKREEQHTQRARGGKGHWQLIGTDGDPAEGGLKFLTAESSVLHQKSP